MTDAFDEKALMEEIDNDIEFLTESLGMFDEDTPSLLRQIRSAASSDDAEGLIKPAHTLKGLVGNFCAYPAETAARELETMAREGQLAGVEEAIEKLRSEVGRLGDALHHFVETEAK